jgi:cbb3-type cytochrome oxidase maturation protein
MSYFFLIPVSIALGLTGLGAFFWSLRHDQYDDLDGAAARILSATDAPAQVLNPDAIKMWDAPLSRPLKQTQ